MKINKLSNGNSSTKTFVIAAASLAIFGSLIYSSNNVDTLEDNSKSANYKKVEAEAVAENKAQPSPFKELAEAKPTADSPAVLQASDEDSDPTLVSGTNSEGTSNTGSPLAAGTTPQTSPSVPVTGTTSVTIAALLSVFALSVGVMMLAKNPRKLALARFEKRITKKL